MSEKSHGIELDPAIERKLLVGLIIALLIVAGMAWAAIQNNARQAESGIWVESTHAFILEADGIVSALNAAEASQRTFLLTGDEPTKLAAANAFADVNEHLSVAQKLAFKKPSQLQRLDRVATLLQRQIDWNKEAARLRAESPGAAAAVFTNAQTRANSSDIEREITALKLSENMLLQEREQKLQRHTRRTEQILYTGAALNLILLAMAFYVVQRDLNTRRRAAAALKAANESLEQKVKERTAELASANDKLTIENMEQKWGQSALQRLVSHHELILNSIHDGILVISRNGKIISTNAAAADLALREAKQMVGRGITDLLVDKETNGAKIAWDKHFLAGTVKEGTPLHAREAFLKRPDGGLSPVRVACYPTRDQENLTGAVITVTKT